MSDCGVCVGGSGYDFDTEMYRSVPVKRSGRDWECAECGRKIPKGSSYQLASGLTEGHYWNVKTCLLCEEIASAFSCNGRMHGNFWEDMDECWEAINTSCFSRLQTPQAKAEFRTRWMDWKGLLA